VCYEFTELEQECSVMDVGYVRSRFWVVYHCCSWCPIVYYVDFCTISWYIYTIYEVASSSEQGKDCSDPLTAIDFGLGSC
jgi:hypothetical protein